MPSELAESICTTYFNNSEGALLRNVIDAELQELRECVELLAHPKFITDGSGAIRYYVTKSDVQFAREVFERLRVDGGKGE